MGRIQVEQRIANFGPVALLIFATLLWPLGAKGETFTANMLIAGCDSENEDIRAACHTFIMGAIEGMKWGASISAANSGFTKEQAMRDHAQTLLGVCDPEAVTRRQGLEVVMRYIRDNPRLWHQSAIVLIYSALVDAFPCR